MHKRKFSDAEVGQILSRAAALQAGSSEGVSADGVSLEELQRIAGEVGIASSAIEQAALELGRKKTISASADSDSVLVEQEVGEVSDELWDRFVTAVRLSSGRAGQSTITARGREWVGKSETETLGWVLSTTSDAESTKLKLIGDSSGATTPAYMMGIFSTIFLTLIPIIVSSKNPALHIGWALTFALSVLIVTFCVLATKVAVRICRKKFQRRVNGVMDQLVDLANQEDSTTKSDVRSLIAPEPTQVEVSG